MKRNIVILTVLFIFCITLPALARDQKIYPGTMGVERGGNANANERYGSIYNQGTSDLFLYLPIIRDNSGSIASGWVKVQDRHYSSNVSCKLCCVYMNSNGSFTGSYSSTKYSSGSNPAPQTLYFGYQSTYSNAHVYMDCRIPPQYLDKENQSCLISYSLTENDPTM